MSMTIHKILNWFIPIIENKYTATLPFTTTSKIKMDGITDVNKYMEEMMTIALPYDILKPKITNK